MFVTFSRVENLKLIYIQSKLFICSQRPGSMVVCIVQSLLNELKQSNPLNVTSNIFRFQGGGSNVVYVSCFGIRVSVMFHFMFVHYTFSSVWVAEWPPFGK